jgi:hypothetical protein
MKANDNKLETEKVILPMPPFVTGGALRNGCVR